MFCFFHAISRRMCVLKRGGLVVSIPPHAVRAYVVSRDIALKQFYPTWRVFTDDFEITEIGDRMNALKIYGGKEIKKLAHNLLETAPVVRDDDYKKLKRKLNNHFLPKKNKHHARYTFNKQKQTAGESVVTYAA